MPVLNYCVHIVRSPNNLIPVMVNIIAMEMTYLTSFTFTLFLYNSLHAMTDSAIVCFKLDIYFSKQCHSKYIILSQNRCIFLLWICQNRLKLKKKIESHYHLTSYNTLNIVPGIFVFDLSFFAPSEGKFGQGVFLVKCMQFVVCNFLF